MFTKKITLVCCLAFAFALSAQDVTIIKIDGKPILVGDKLCYQIKKWKSGKDTMPYDVFCGEFDCLPKDWEWDKVHTFVVDKYDMNDDTIHIRNMITRSSYGYNYYKLYKTKNFCRRKNSELDLDSARVGLFPVFDKKDYPSDFWDDYYAYIKRMKNRQREIRDSLNKK